MSFKNAIKLVFSRFGLVWTKLLSVFLTTLLIASLCVDPVLDLYNWLVSVGFVGELSVVWEAYVGGGNFASFIDSFIILIKRFFEYYATHPDILWNFTLRMGVLIMVLYKFILTTFELCFSKQIFGIMSDNSRPQFWTTYISQFTKALSYALVKTVAFALYDMVTILVVYLVTIWLGGVLILLPFAWAFVLIFFLTIRSSLFFAWTPYISVENKGVVKSLGKSVVLFFKNFSKVFSAFLIGWICVVSLCSFSTIFTFGVALIIVIPISSIFLSFLNMTLFYSSNGMRYYMNDKIFDVNYIQ